MDPKNRKVPESPVKNKTFLQSILCSLRGTAFAFKTEKNFKYYFAIAAFFLIINLWRHVSLTGHAIYLICCGGVFSAEMMNTALEHLSNFMTSELHETIKVAKDIGAAGVVMWGFVYFGVEAILLCQTF